MKLYATMCLACVSHDVERSSHIPASRHGGACLDVTDSIPSVLVDFLNDLDPRFQQSVLLDN